MAVMIRPATRADMACICEIYAYYVENTVITYEEIVPDVDEMQQRFFDIQSHNMPYLVAEIDGVITGYAYASVYRTRPAYRYCVEHSIYLNQDHQGHGVGSQLMEALINSCLPTGIRQMIAVIGDTTNHASVALHEKFGFTHVGILKDSGFKFNRWIDTIIMQRPIGAGATSLPTGKGLNLK
jgi:L-amino acid N-acyltransferase YncA